MARSRACDAAVIRGRLDRAIEFLDAAELLESESPNAAGDLFVDAGVAASDVVCCVRLGEHATGANHSDAVALLEKADKGSAKHLRTLLSMKSKAAYTHESLSASECKKMNRAASQLVATARLVAR